MKWLVKIPEQEIEIDEATNEDEAIEFAAYKVDADAEPITEDKDDKIPATA